MASVGDLLARIDALSGRLRVVGGDLEYDGPLAALTEELKTAIRAARPALIEAIKSNRITVLVCRLAEFGAGPTIVNGTICLEVREGTPESVLPKALLDEACARAEELEAFARKPVEEFTDQELADLDYRRVANGKILIAGKEFDALHSERRPAATPKRDGR